jgi:hypothetical protein
MFATGGLTQPVERRATQKALGGPLTVGMTSEARDWHHGVKGSCPGAFEPFKSYMINLTSIALVHRTNFGRCPKIGLRVDDSFLISKIPLFSFARIYCAQTI